MTEAKPSSRIEADLRESIASGHYSPGQQLPSIRALTDQYGVARQTISNVLDRLRTEGLVEGRKGAGVFVCDRPAVQAEVRHRAENARAIERISTRRATSADSAATGVPPGSLVLVVVRTENTADGATSAPETFVVPGDQYELVYELTE